MNLKQFLELFNPYPGNSYLHISTQDNEISKELTKLMQSVDGEFKLILYNDDNLDFSKPFRALPREHDIVILQDIVSKHKKPETVVKTAYTTLANTADIILLEKSVNMSLDSMKSLLEEYEFRAINDIDIIDGYHLVMAN